jgi:hypothetical protein
MSLGLHVRNGATTLSDVDKELRVRIWWSLYSLERSLNGLMGRPSCISDGDISTPLPINQDEETFEQSEKLEESRRPSTYLADPAKNAKKSPPKSKSKASSGRSSISDHSSASLYPNRISPSKSEAKYPPSPAFTLPITKLEFTSSTYFIYRTQLAIISHEIFSKLYSASSIKFKWNEIQITIGALDTRLSEWKDSLPDELKFGANSIKEYEYERIGLEMYFYSSRMSLFRLCLCDFAGRIPNESNHSKMFNQDAVKNCIESARAVLKLFPDHLVPAKIYEIKPWWTILHHLCEAASVLMLEMSYRAEHVPAQVEEIVKDAKKAVRWLHALSAESIAARKGWEIFYPLLCDVAGQVGCDTDDLDSDAPVPPTYLRNLGVNLQAPDQVHHHSNQHNFGHGSGKNEINDTHLSQLPFASMPDQVSDLTNEWIQHGQFNNPHEYPAANYSINSNPNYLFHHIPMAADASHTDPLQAYHTLSSGYQHPFTSMQDFTFGMHPPQNFTGSGSAIAYSTRAQASHSIDPYTTSLSPSSLNASVAPSYSNPLYPPTAYHASLHGSQGFPGSGRLDDNTYGGTFFPRHINGGNGPGRGNMQSHRGNNHHSGGWGSET